MNKPASIFSGGWTPEKAEKYARFIICLWGSDTRMLDVAQVTLNMGYLSHRLIRIFGNALLTGCYRFKSIQLPDKLKPVMQFSNKQQLDLKQRIAGYQGDKAKLPTAEIITCRTCTSGQTQELTCILCGEAKGLEAFGKTQRKNPDTARCTVCVHEQGKEKWAHIEWHPDDEDDEDSDDGGSRANTNPYEHAYSYSHDDKVDAVSSGLKEATLTSHNNAHGFYAKKHGSTIISESDLLKSYSDEDLVKENIVKGKGKEKAHDWQGFAVGNDEKEPKAFTGYDSKGGAHHQIRQPSTAASAYSVDIQTENPGGRPGYSTAKVLEQGGKFAKPPRGRSPVPRPGNIIEQLKANTGGRTVHSDDEETDDDEWGAV
ncbi:MAG: hypothetical protein Q9184_002684 [Pyrenodesmia sp. 2 TL-2023]